MFGSITALHYEAWRWSDQQNNWCHDVVYCIPYEEHQKNCLPAISELTLSVSVRLYLWVERKIFFDIFVNYEGRRFGGPYQYVGKTYQISRQEFTLYIYTTDLKDKLVEHLVT